MSADGVVLPGQWCLDGGRDGVRAISEPLWVTANYLPSAAADNGDR